MNNLQIIGKFKIYDHLVVGIDKNIYQLAHARGRTTLNFRKLKYYEKRDAYGYNGSYISKKRLFKLFYKKETTVNKLESIKFNTKTWSN